MYKKNRIAVVIPVYNEEKLISKTVTTIPDYVDKIIVVDDKSKDNTLNIIKTFDKKFQKKLLILKHDKNQGVGESIKSGYKKSLELGMDITAVMAGDAQMDPDQLYRLLDPITEGKTDYTNT